MPNDDRIALSRRWHDAREQHRDELVGREGEANFAGLRREASTEG